MPSSLIPLDLATDTLVVTRKVDLPKMVTLKEATDKEDTHLEMVMAVVKEVATMAMKTRNRLNTNSNTTSTPTKKANKSNSVTKNKETATSLRANTTSFCPTEGVKWSNTRLISPDTIHASRTLTKASAVLEVLDVAATATATTAATEADHQDSEAIRVTTKIRDTPHQDPVVADRNLAHIKRPYTI